MREVINIVQKINGLFASRVDQNFGQGRDAVRSQLLKRLSGDNTLEIPIEELIDLEQSVDDWFSASRNNLSELESLVMPLKLPLDYRFFLEYAGGLVIADDQDVYRLELCGLGPMVEEWYESLTWRNMSQPKLRENQILLDIGYLRFEADKQTSTTLTTLKELPEETKVQWVQFYLDLSGTFEKESVLAMERGKNGELAWRQIATSFTEFLGQVAMTEGKLGYV